MAAQLKDKVAIVTGSNSGIGEAVALMFASRGAKVTICGRDQDRLRSVFDTIVSASGGDQDRFLTVAGDVTDSRVREEIVSQTIKKFGRLDILVANAGIIGPNQHVLTATEEVYNVVMDTNLKSVFFLIQQAVPHLEASKGCIINISSILSSLVKPQLVIYSMTKAALDHLTRCLAVDLGSKGIRVNSVNPSYIKTRIGRFYGENSENIAKTIAALDIQKQPFRERALNVNDIAEAVSFLASYAAGFITGVQMKVDGGRNFGGSS